MRNERLVVSVRLVETFDHYEAWCEGQDWRPRAIATYMRNVRRFAAWMGEEATIADVTAERVEAYQVSLRGRAASTIAQHLSAIRSYCRWCQRKRLRFDDPTVDLKWPKRRRRLPRPLKAEELRQLEEIRDRSPPVLDRKARRLWFRNRRIVLLLLYTGMRRAEVAGLCWLEVDLDEEVIIVCAEHAKGGNERVVPLHPRLVAELRLTPRRERRGAVAGHKDGRCLSHKTIGAIFECWLREQGLTINAHRLRHTCGTEMLKSGADLREIQKTLGHEDIRTTEGYVDLVIEQQRSAIQRLPDRFG